MTFWLRRFHLGRLYVCLGRNEWIYQQKRERAASAHLTSYDGMVFLTFRIRATFLNIDWI